jgi:hypothetical protein
MLGLTLAFSITLLFGGFVSPLAAEAQQAAKIPRIGLPGVDLIVTAAGTLDALAAKKATRTLPVIFIGAGDPVTSGLVTSLAQPGGNVTGLSLLFPELVGKCRPGIGDEDQRRPLPGASGAACRCRCATCRSHPAPPPRHRARPGRRRR